MSIRNLEKSDMSYGNDKGRLCNLLLQSDGLSHALKCLLLKCADPEPIIWG